MSPQHHLFDYIPVIDHDILNSFQGMYDEAIHFREQAVGGLQTIGALDEQTQILEWIQGGQER